VVLNGPVIGLLSHTAALVMTPWSLVRDAPRTPNRRTAALRHDTAETARAARTVLVHLAAALEAGALDDLRAGLADIGVAVDLMQTMTVQIEQALPVLDATAPALGMVNGTLAQLNATAVQIEGLPGMRMARRLVRPTPSREVAALA
jgi:hypothetical protein